MIEVDYARAVELVKSAMEQEGPNYVYKKLPHPSGYGTMCANVVKDDKTGEIKGSCLIGRALILAGVDAKWLWSNSSATGVGLTVDRLQQDGILKATPKAVQYWSEIQKDQDGGVSWSQAIATADNTSPEVARMSDDLSNPYNW